MKHTITTALTCIGLAAWSLVASAQESTTQSQPVLLATNVQLPVIVVSGRGQVKAPPDRAVVRLGIEAESKEASEAQSDVNDIAHKSIAAIEALGVPRKSIRTVGVNLHPVYDNPRPGRESKMPRIIGYRAVNSLQVELGASDLGLVGQVLDKGLESGANRLEGLSFDLRDDTKARAEALQKAVREAAAKADAIAGALGVLLGKPEEVVESESEMPPPRPMMMRSMAGAEAAASTPVEPGVLHVGASVTIRYRISEKTGAK